MPHKRVEFTELFYDLVFVYAIAQIAHLLHHLHDGWVNPLNWFSFISSGIFLINFWVLQTVYTNRHGRNSFPQMLAFFAQMPLLLLISSETTTDSQLWFANANNYSLAFGGLTAIHLLQYVLTYFKSDTNYQETIKPYFYILGIRLGFILLSFLIPSSMLGFIIFQIGMYLTFLLPNLFRQQFRAVPVNFPHLVERFSLLIILTLGEMIIGLVDYFTWETVSWASIGLILTVILLFLYYFTEMDHMIDNDKASTTGVGLIYLHYPIFFGLLMITASFGFLNQDSVNPVFLVASLYGGLALFFVSLYLIGHYNQEKFRLTRSFLIQELMLLLVSAVLALVLPSPATIYLLLPLTTGLLFTRLIRIYFKNA